MNHSRLAQVFSMGFVGTEVESTTSVSFRPLIGLQTWIYSRSRSSKWAQDIAPRILEAEPEGLYQHWSEMKDMADGSVILRNPAFDGWPWDPYDLVRIDPSNTPAEIQYLDKVLADLASRPLTDGAVAPASAAAVTEKPWWEE